MIFSILYIVVDILLIVFNCMLLHRIKFIDQAWPIIAIAIPASLYLSILDISKVYNWWPDIEYLFTTSVMIYKVMILVGLVLSIIRMPILELEIAHRKLDGEREDVE